MMFSTRIPEVDVSASVDVLFGVDLLLVTVRDLEFELTKLLYVDVDFIAGVPSENLDDIINAMQWLTDQWNEWNRSIQEQQRQCQRHWIDNNKRLVALPVPGSGSAS